MKEFLRLVVLVAPVVMAPAVANAQRAVLVWENDAVGRADRDYTQGFRGSVVFDDVSKHLLTSQLFDVARIGLFPLGAPDGPKRQQLEWIVGQSIFSPDKVSAPVRAPGDRPFGGWLYTGISVAEETGRRQLDSFEFLAGVVGPASLANETQRAFHSLIGNAAPIVNNYQIQNEPGFVLSWDRRWKIGADFGNGDGVDVIPSVGVSVGNVFTHASAGAIVRYGRSLSTSWGPTRVRPGPSGASFLSPDPTMPWLGYAIFAGVEGRAVARNIFLDGNTFSTSPKVKSKPLVADLIAGAELFTQSGHRLAFTATYRTKEYTTQPRDSIFGSVEASVKF